MTLQHVIIDARHCGTKLNTSWSTVQQKIQMTLYELVILITLLKHSLSLCTLLNRIMKRFKL
jgi:hypothetical protein